MKRVFENYLTTKMLMDYLKISYSTIRRLVKNGRLHPEVVSGRRFFDIKDIERYLASSYTPPASLDKS